MFKLNSFCSNCFDPYKIVWNCKKHIQDKEWIHLCGNCVRYYRAFNKHHFKSQFQNITAIIRCSLKLSKLELPLYNINSES